MIEFIELDNSGRSLFKACKRKYLFQIVHGLQSDFGSTAIRYGVVWHGIQEGYHSYIKEHGWPRDGEELQVAIQQGLKLGLEKWEEESKKKTFIDDFKNYNTAVEAFGEYLEAFKDDSKYIKVIETEKRFRVQMQPDDRTQELLLKDLPPIFFTGRIDLCVEMDGMNWLFDFKTTSWRLDEVISKANRSPQLLGYSYAGMSDLDFEADGCLLSFAQLSAYKSRKTGDYGTVKHEFRRVPQIFTPQDMYAWKVTFLDTARDICRCFEEDIWPESFDNCFQYGACPYLKLCRQHKNDINDLNLDGFHVDFWSVLED